MMTEARKYALWQIIEVDVNLNKAAPDRVNLIWFTFKTTRRKHVRTISAEEHRSQSFLIGLPDGLYGVNPCLGPRKSPMETKYLKKGNQIALFEKRDKQWVQTAKLNVLG